jgi:hypothetical protein
VLKRTPSAATNATGAQDGTKLLQDTRAVVVEAINGGEVDVGMVVDIKGSIKTFRDDKQINIEKIKRIRCTEEEVALWEKRTQFKTDVLEKSWTLSDKQIRKCRKEAERTGDTEKKKKKREKRWNEEESSHERTRDRIAKTTKRSDKESARLSRLDILHILQSDVKGKYDALGL